MASWFKCRACTARCTEQLSLGVGTIPFCPSCGHPTLERCEGPDAHPSQDPMFLLPVPPRAIRWKIEWQWTPACIQNTREIFNEILPEGWFFHSEYSTERQAVNTLARLRRRDAPNRHCRVRARHHRMKPCLWYHSGDIELALPMAPVKKYDTPTDYAAIDALVAAGDMVDTFVASSIALAGVKLDPAKFGPYCGSDCCDDPSCLTHQDKPLKSEMSENELYQAQFEPQYLDLPIEVTKT